MKVVEEYKKLELQKIKVGAVSLGLRQIGSGESMVFLHGFPTHGYTWRKIVSTLSEHFSCHLLDMPGLGDSEWTRSTDFNIDAQAERVQQLLTSLGISKFNLIAHDSGGTIARIIAMNIPNRVKNLILINTEIPEHRPPFIELYQKIGLLPFVSYYFRKKLSQKKFVKSSMGFKQAYSDRKMLDDDSNLGPYLNPLIQSKNKTIGAFKFLKGIDWNIIDGFKHTHKKIKSNVLFIWGENDKTFPLNLGKEMLDQFTSKTEFKIIANASLLPHEEKPKEVLTAILQFCNKST